MCSVVAQYTFVSNGGGERGGVWKVVMTTAIVCTDQHVHQPKRKYGWRWSEALDTMVGNGYNSEQWIRDWGIWLTGELNYYKKSHIYHRRNVYPRGGQLTCRARNVFGGFLSKSTKWEVLPEIGCAGDGARAELEWG